MQMSPDVRYVNDGRNTLAVEFDGCYFTAYHVGSENVGVNISMEMVIGAYPEAHNESLIRVGRYHVTEPEYGVWALQAATVDGLPPVPKKVVKELNDDSTTTFASLQQRLEKITPSEFDIIKTLEQTVEALDDVIASPHKAAVWASAMLPIMQAAVLQGVSIDTIVEETHKRVDRLERKQNL